MTTVSRDMLRSFVERIERLEEEKKTIAEDIKDVFGEAKGLGFDVKILKKVIALRKKDDQERMEEEAILGTYLHALGMLQHDLFEDEPASATREDRSKRRTSEAMADHKTLIDEMADAGLISEEARHDNKRLADAVAEKFGNGRAMAAQSSRLSDDVVSEPVPERSDGGTRIVHKHTNIQGLPETANEMQHPGSHLIGNPEPALAAANRPNSDDGMVRMARTEAAAVTAGETATNSPIAPASQGESEAPAPKNVSLPDYERSGEGADTGGIHEKVIDGTTAQTGGLVDIPPVASKQQAQP